MALVFLCRRRSGVERLSDETTDWRWITRDEAELLMPPAWSVRFADALDAASALGGGRPAPVAAVRVHDGVALL